MNLQVTLKDVARIAGVSETTVSLVVNGKASRRGIIPATQARVMAAIQKLGYHPDLTSRSRALHQVVPRAVAKPEGISYEKSQITEEVPKPIGRQIGLVLSAASPTGTLALVPVLENVLRVEGFRLNIAVIPADPTSARERITRLRGEGSVGIIACPSVYTAVTATVAGGCPVIVLWQDAAKAMLAALRPNQSPTPTPAPAPVPAPPPVVTPVNPVTVDTPALETPDPEPVIEETPPNSPPVQDVIEEPISAPVVMEVQPQGPEPTPEPIAVETPVPEPPPFQPDPVPTPDEVLPEPIITPTPPPTEPVTETLAKNTEAPSPDGITLPAETVESPPIEPPQ
ncbi:MAG: LacI family DNA-binding transcriptional regulator [bacterium]